MTYLDHDRRRLDTYFRSGALQSLPAPNGEDPSPEEALEEEDPARSATMEDTAMPPPAPPPAPVVVCPRPLPPPTDVTADDEDAPRPDSADPELK